MQRRFAQLPEQATLLMPQWQDEIKRVGCRWQAKASITTKNLACLRSKATEPWDLPRDFKEHAKLRQARDSAANDD